MDISLPGNVIYLEYLADARFIKACVVYIVDMWLNVFVFLRQLRHEKGMRVKMYFILYTYCSDCIVELLTCCKSTYCIQTIPSIGIQLAVSAAKLSSYGETTRKIRRHFKTNNQ